MGTKQDTALAVVPHAETAMAAPVSFESMRQMADVIAKSRLFPDVQTPEAALTLMLLCQSEGLSPVSALRRYHIIKGRPTMKSDAMLADFQRQGGKVRWVKSDEHEACCSFSHPSGGEVEFAFTIAEANRAGLTDNPSWKKFPAAMLRARCISGGIRMILPGVVSGMYTPEEVEDFSPSVPARVVSIVEAEPVDAPLNTAADVFGETEPAKPTENVVTTLVAEVRKKEGQKNGKPWTLYTVLCDGERKFTTFDVKLAEAAKAFAGTGERVLITFEKAQYGQTITGISAEDQPPFEQ